MVTVADTNNTTENDVQQQILRQVEFYFSDANFSTDKFLQGIAEKNDGFVEIATIATFKRMKPFSENLSLITEALRKSTKLALSEDGTKVRRVDPLPDPAELVKRVVYVRGLPPQPDADIEKLQQEFETYFATLGNCQAVRLQRRGKRFVGKVFVEFSSEEEARQVAQKSHTYQEHTLEMETSDAYAERKSKEWSMSVEEIMERLKRREYRPPYLERRKNATEVALAREGVEIGQVNGRSFPRNTLVKFTNAPENTTFLSLKKVLLEKNAPRAQFVTLEENGRSGMIRLKEPKAKELVAEFGDKLELDGQTLSLSVVEGEEEAAYWAACSESTCKASIASLKKARGGASGGKRSNKRAREEDEEEAQENGTSETANANKMAKVE